MMTIMKHSLPEAPKDGEMKIKQRKKNPPHMKPPTYVQRYQPTSAAQLDARLTRDQGVAGSTPAGSATFFRGDLIMKCILRSFSPFH